MSRDSRSLWVFVAAALLLAGCRASPRTAAVRSAGKPVDPGAGQPDDSPFQSYNARRGRQRTQQIDQVDSPAPQSVAATTEPQTPVTPLESLDQEQLSLTRRLSRQVDQHLASESRHASEPNLVSTSGAVQPSSWGHGRSASSPAATGIRQTAATQRPGAAIEFPEAPGKPGQIAHPRSAIRSAGAAGTQHQDTAVRSVEFIGQVLDGDAGDPAVTNADNISATDAARAPLPNDSQPFGPTDLSDPQQTAGDEVAWEVELHKLIDLVRSDAEELEYSQETHDEFLRQHVNLRLLQFVAGQPEKALHSIPNIDADQQEFWQQLFWGLSNYFASQDYPNARERVTFTADDLSRAVQKLRHQALLKVQNINFCSKIYSFGSYDRIRVPRFSASERVLIYAEIENFKSKELIAAGKYQTKLSSVIQIFSGEQTQASDPSATRLLHTQEFATTVDLCSRPRRDFFNAYTYILPRDLAPGPHTLVLKVRDELSGGEAVERLNFEVE